MRKISIIVLLLLVLVVFASCARDRTATADGKAQASAASDDSISADINDAGSLADEIDLSDMDQIDKDLDLGI